MLGELKIPCSNELREKAKLKKKFIVTICVNGKYAKDDSMTVQRLASLEQAKEACALALKLLNAKSEVGIPSGLSSESESVDETGVTLGD